MSIRKLPATVVDQVRSTLTIDSLARCVHELLANSIDAKATRITVYIHCEELECSVIDNGVGILPDDMLSVGQQYATSKCRSLNDLHTRIQTYGFRGEGLSSIMKSADVVVTSSPHEQYHRARTEKRMKRRKTHHEKGQQFGTVIADSSQFVSTSMKHVRYGELIDLRKYDPANTSDSTLFMSSHGTTVKVRQLFHNLPARLKWSKQHAAKELPTIRSSIEKIALIHPSVALTLTDTQSNRVLLQKASLPDVRSAFAHLYHTKLAANLLPLPNDTIMQVSTSTRQTLAKRKRHDSKHDELTIDGAICKLSESFPSRDLQQLYVNNRYVIHKPIGKLIEAIFTRAAKVMATGVNINDENDTNHDSSTQAEKQSSSHARKVNAAAAKIQLASKSKSNKTRTEHYPYFLLNIRCSPSAYDITFHPDKTNIRFVHEDAMLQAIESTLRDWLYLHYPSLESRDSYLFPPRHRFYNNINNLHYDKHSPTPFIRLSPLPFRDGVQEQRDSMLSTKEFIPLSQQDINHVFIPENLPSESLLALKTQCYEDADHAAAYHTAEKMAYDKSSTTTGQEIHSATVKGSRNKMHCHCTECTPFTNTVTKHPNDDTNDCHCHLCEIRETQMPAIESTAVIPTIAQHAANIDFKEIGENDNTRYTTPCKSNPAESTSMSISMPLPKNYISVREAVDSFLASKKHATSSKESNQQPRKQQENNANTDINDVDLQHMFPDTRHNAASAVQVTRHMLQSARILSQFDGKFILLEVDGTLIAVDQHAADERIRAEHLAATIDDHIQHRPCVPPMVTELTPSEIQVVEDNLQILERWGFTVEVSDTCTCDVFIHSVPQVFDTVLTAQHFRDYIAEIADNTLTIDQFQHQLPNAVGELVSSRACRSAIMFGHSVSYEEANKLIRSLVQCDMPFNCAHGRPSLVALHSIQQQQHQATDQNGNHDYSSHMDEELLNSLSMPVTFMSLDVTTNSPIR
jgi:DNA mismatch repair ATPase MutL